MQTNALISEDSKHVGITDAVNLYERKGFCDYRRWFMTLHYVILTDNNYDYLL